MTEGVTGLDLVRAQLLVASGEPPALAGRGEISQRGRSRQGAASARKIRRKASCRRPGRLTEYREPQLPGVRVDSGVVEVAAKSPRYWSDDVASVIATAESRAVGHPRRPRGGSCGRFASRGIRSNLGFPGCGCSNPTPFYAARSMRGFLDREGAEVCEGLRRREHPGGSRSGWSRDSYRVFCPSERSQAGRVRPRNAHRGAQSSTGARSRPGGGNESSSKVARLLSAPMPATVIKIAVKPADAVKPRSDVVVLLEAMKMELPLRAEADGHRRRHPVPRGRTGASRRAALELQ